MTASAAERPRAARGARGVGRALALVAALAAAGCQATAPTPMGGALAPLPGVAAYVPDETDLALRDLAEALLADDAAGADEAVERVAWQDVAGGEATGALPHALDARTALEPDPIARRRAAIALLERDDLSAELRTRIEQETRDDPLLLAAERMGDARTRRYGRAFNALSQAIGRSLSDTTLLPWRVANALIAIAVAEHMDDELTLPERQALSHWKAYIEQHPDTPEAAELVEAVAEAQARWYETYRERAVRAADDAMQDGDPARAVALLDRALRYAPEDPEAFERMQRAQAALAERRVAWARSVSRPLAAEPPGDAELRLATALLASHDEAGLEEVARQAEALRETAQGGPLADDAGFVLAMVDGERGRYERMWDELEALADEDPAASNVSRHAAALVTSPRENPYRTWRLARRADLADRVRWLLFGPLAHGPRERNMPWPVEWALEIPTLVPVVTGFGNRLVRLPFLGPGRRSPGVFAHRYLERYPDGEEADDVRSWLVDFEADRGNYMGALRVAEAGPDPDPEKLAELRGQAAENALEVAREQAELLARVELLQAVATRFEGTPAGSEAAWELRETVREATPQSIRVSRGFLDENPSVAGAQGLALRPELLDGRASNGEIHPEGVTLLDARRIEVAYLSETGDPRDPPVRRRERISAERMRRLVASLDEASLHMARTDRDYPIEHDADRDLFFERARLGLAGRAHPSPEAHSSYAFRGVRERYGLVRGRESILPVELVVQGSFEDLSLGAFPRIRMPRPTPDAFLYD